jgi:hypothetical protein
MAISPQVKQIEQSLSHLAPRSMDTLLKGLGGSFKHTAMFYQLLMSGKLFSPQKLEVRWDL